MRRKLIPLIPAFAACLAGQGTLANDIEPTKEFITATRASGPITIDGSLSEWAGAPIISDPKFSICEGMEGTGGAEGCGASGQYVLFERYQGGDWTGPDDHTSAVQIVYDDENVYVGVVVTDEYHENAANSSWNGDSVQLMFTNGERNNTLGLYYYALGGVEGALGDVITLAEAGPGGTEGTVIRDEAAKKTYYEIRIPATAIGMSSFSAGTQFGLGMAINDGDEMTPGQKGWGGLGVHALVYNGKNPEHTALITLGASETTVEILGVGDTALIGGDLTDPEGDGDELAGPEDPSWNWASISGNIKAFFDGGEGAFNIFDNLTGGGNNKWCCDDPTEENPYWVSVEFPNPVNLTHFTITSGNDTPDRDPINFEIQGSNDGVTFTPIYVRNDPTSLWTARDQVIKFTLPTPAPSYRHIRYLVKHTSGTLHQIGEIEYFGTVGTANVFFLSAINQTVDRFTFRATDVEGSVVDPATAKLTIDGQVATLTFSETGDATDFRFVPASPFLPGSEHTYVIEVRDALGNTVRSEGTFETQQYALLMPSEKVTPVTGQPGFIWNVHQNPTLTAATVARANDQLAGLLGENFADPNAQGAAIAPGTPGANNRLPVRFEIATVINLNEDANFLMHGDIQPDEQMPGIPSMDFTAPTDGIAAEIITYLELPAGLSTLIVNSDDGFRTTAGQVSDVFRAQVAGEFNAGRGAADTAYIVYAQEAGVYPFRTVWFEGGSDANIEWKSVLADGTTEVLINDRASGGIPAYRAASGAPTAISSVTPSRNATGVSGDSPLSVRITEGADTVDLATVQLTLNGEAVTAPATRSGNVITASFQPEDLLAAGSTNTATIAYTAGGVARTETWNFVVANYGLLTAGMRVTPDTTKPGFIWNVHQNPNFTATDNTRTVRQLAGLLGPNFADPFSQGSALEPGVVPADPLLPIRFEIPTVINLNQDAFIEQNGEFVPDDQMPGIPGLSLTAPTDGIAGEVITYIELPAGKTTLIVNSDDNFITMGGNITDIFGAQVLGSFNAGRGAADTAYDFFVEEAGVYPFRTVWGEGGGGANIEWKYVKADGTRVLINDTANGGPRAYRAVTTASSLPSITSVSPGIDARTAIATAPVQVTILEGGTQVENASVQLTINGGTVTPTVNRTGQTVTISHQPANPFSPNSTNTVQLRFTAGGVERVEEWSFITPAITRDVISERPGLILGTAKFTGDAGGRSGAEGDFAIDFGRTGTAPSVLVPDATFLNAAAANDTMTVTFWVKKYDNANNSAFWIDSPSSASAARGLQAHVPWSDNNVYFDSAGCCNADETRISAGIDTFPGFTGPAWWTDEWHHWAFVKNGFSKQIYIDGEIFLDGFGNPLPTDLARIWIGAEGGSPFAGTANNIHGLIDDFAVFGTALTPAQIQQLANGTAPNTLPSSANTLAYWNFNDVTDIPVEEPVITISASGDDITITWTNGGSLQASPAVDGAEENWQDVDSDGSYSTTATEEARFFRVVRP